MSWMLLLQITLLVFLFLLLLVVVVAIVQYSKDRNAERLYKLWSADQFADPEEEGN